MYSPLPSFVLGFHGCDRDIKKKLLTGVTGLEQSDNEYDWLGHGIYFWEHNVERALEFAIEIQKHPGRHKTVIKHPAVIGAVIDLGNCLNLLNAEYIKLVKQSYENLKEICESAGTPLPENTHKDAGGIPLKRNLDCAVIESLHTMTKNNDEQNYDSIRSVFIEGSSLYADSGFNEKNHIQICVVNPQCIKGYFNPLD